MPKIHIFKIALSKNESDHSQLTLLHKEAFLCGLIKIDTATASLICIWLVSYLFMHSMNDGLQVSLINQMFHMKTADFDLFSCCSKQSIGPPVTWLQATNTKTEMEKITAEHNYFKLLCVSGVWQYIVCLCCVGKTQVFPCVLFCWFLICRQSAMEIWKLCWTLVITLCYFFINARGCRKQHVVFLSPWRPLTERMVFLSCCFLLSESAASLLLERTYIFQFKCETIVQEQLKKGVHVPCVCLCDTASADILILTLPVQMGAAWSGVSCFQSGHLFFLSTHISFSALFSSLLFLMRFFLLFFLFSSLSLFFIFGWFCSRGSLEVIGWD